MNKRQMARRQTIKMSHKRRERVAKHGRLYPYRVFINEVMIRCRKPPKIKYTPGVGHTIKFRGVEQIVKQKPTIMRQYLPGDPYPPIITVSTATAIP